MKKDKSQKLLWRSYCAFVLLPQISAFHSSQRQLALYSYLLFLNPCRVLLCDRQESRPSEWMIRKVLGVVAHAFPTAYSIPVVTVARAMVNNVVMPGSNDQKVEILENAAIHALGQTK